MNNSLAVEVGVTETHAESTDLNIPLPFIVDRWEVAGPATRNAAWDCLSYGHPPLKPFDCGRCGNPFHRCTCQDD